ncbi:hypothetical protein Acr_00g0017110 [Actinidia rufa]|uniref:Uncharacterized protein n=1 Tax=Actinidia rufa TaxID=165716 RepID=A0A7J0DB41_9ERIC|nr:hypothetical protein Acr_00g0017110 [Actinidia rufa]
MASRVPTMVLSPMAIEGSSMGGRSGLLSDLVVSIEGSPCGLVSFNLETPASGPWTPAFSPIFGALGFVPNGKVLSDAVMVGSASLGSRALGRFMVAMGGVESGSLVFG